MNLKDTLERHQKARVRLTAARMRVRDLQAVLVDTEKALKEARSAVARAKSELVDAVSAAHKLLDADLAGFATGAEVDEDPQPVPENVTP